MWTVTNAACADIDHVSIAAPGGWTFAADGYAVVSNTVGSQVDTWTLAGTTFSSPNATDRIPLAGTGDFSLLYSFTPAAAGLNTFTITVTDATGMSRTVQSVVLVNPFNTGGLNATSTGIWQEEVR
jgi:hypothetical protein